MAFLFKNHLEYDHRQMELEPKTLCQLLHFPSGNALYKCLLNDLNERRLNALAFRNKERDITALTNLGHHEVHRSHAGIQTTRTVSAAVAASSVRALTFLCAQLLIHLSFHELCAEPFQHAQHGIRLRYVNIVTQSRLYQPLITKRK